VGPAHLHRLDRTSLSWRTYSITSSARKSSDVGVSMPIALAVFKFTMVKNFVGCSKTLGLAIPESFLVRADEVIE
jgi:hypothetical protein